MSEFVSVLLKSITAAGAACVLLFASAPAEAKYCPGGTFLCITGSKSGSPKRCCPIKVAKPPQPQPHGLTPPRPGARCLQAVLVRGQGGSVKGKCVRWSSLASSAGC